MIDYSDSYVARHRSWVLTDAELKAQLGQVAVVAGIIGFLLGMVFAWITL